jgi:plasmid stability protein
MAQLLVRNLDTTLIDRLKKRASEEGVSAEEAHRQILREALLPTREKPSLVEFLLSSDRVLPADVDLDLSRSDEFEARDIGI